MRFSYTLPFFAALAAARPTEESLDRRDSGPDAERVQVTGVSFAGSGCPASSSTSGPFLSGTSTLLLSFPNLVARTGKNTAAEDARTNCQANIKVKYPAGWQFSVSKAEYSGHAEIPDGLTGVSKSTYYFSGYEGQIGSEKTLTGPYDADYIRTDQFGSNDAVWSPCGGEALFNINSEVRLAPVATTKAAVITADPLKKVDLVWRRC